MDLTALNPAEVAPLMFKLEEVLADPETRRIVLQDDANDQNKVTLTRGQAQKLLDDFEREFFGLAN